MERDLNLRGLTLVIACILFSLAGCGAQLSRINIAYQPQTDLAAAVPTADRVSLYVEEFTDVRGGPEPHVVGQAKTGMFNKSTPVVIGVDLEQLAIRAFREAFSEAGFNLVDAQDNADLVFKGRINRFWVQEFATGWALEHTEADVELDLVMIDRAREKNIWFDVKSSHVATEATSMDITSENERIISEAFNQVVSSIVNDSELVQAVNDFISSKE